MRVLGPFRVLAVVEQGYLAYSRAERLGRLIWSLEYDIRCTGDPKGIGAKRIHQLEQDRLSALGAARRNDAVAVAEGEAYRSLCASYASSDALGRDEPRRHGG